MKRRAIKSICLGVVCAVGLMGSVLADAPQRLDIPAGDLVAALELLAKQADVELVFKATDLKGLTTSGVKGTYPARDAVELLLKGTNFGVHRDESGAMLIRARGAKSSGNAGPADQMRVAMGSETEKEGASAKEEKGEEDSRQVTVRDKKIKPYSDANVDIPRTINDAQPYYVFSSEEINRSGAFDVEDFLKQRLTMNATVMTGRQRSKNPEAINSSLNTPSTTGNQSSIDLLGLGNDKTLILVNGRRLPNVTFDAGREGQPDLNGIPLSAIDRIEVLPSSASGIYGGSSIGGVVNVILKNDYSGAEIRVNYENTWESDSPSRTISGMYGTSMEGGRTQLMINAQWADSSHLLLKDRLDTFDRYRAIFASNTPPDPLINLFPPPSDHANFGNTLWNFVQPYSIVPLIFDDGTPLGSGFGFVTTGIAPSSSVSEVKLALLQSSGIWSTDLPNSTDSVGLRQTFGSAPTTKSVNASMRRSMTDRVDAFIDFMHSSNETKTVYNPLTTSIFVDGNAPTNPFTTTVWFTMPWLFDVQSTTSSKSSSATVGANVRLPRDWISHVEYTRSENDSSYNYFEGDEAWFSAFYTGQLNAFVDPQLSNYPFEDYLVPVVFRSKTSADSIRAAAAGSLPSFPWGAATLTVGAERVVTKSPEYHLDLIYKISANDSRRETRYGSRRVNDSLYAETLIPLVVPQRYPALSELSVQVAARVDQYEVDTGTLGEVIYINRPSPNILQYLGQTDPNGMPFSSTDTYSSSNRTFGIKYKPISEVTIRASLATAFIPPDTFQLTPDPTPHDADVSDPMLGGAIVPVRVHSGGNPDVRPQHSESTNVGIIWEPEWRRLKGLRVNAEYYRVEQFDAITNLSEQFIVDLESIYSDRVTRDSNGQITDIDASTLNLFGRDTKGVNLALDYRIATSMGDFGLHAAQTRFKTIQTQYVSDLPAFEAVGYSPAEGGATEYNRSAALTWSQGRLSLGWATKYYSSYKQVCAAGGPGSRTRPGGCSQDTIQRQGGLSIDSYISHDLFISYAPVNVGGAQASSGRLQSLVSGVKVQAGIKNVFDTAPSYDANNVSNAYFSYYGDARMRSYWLNLSKTF